MDFSDVALGLAALLVAVISALVAVLVASTFAAPPPPKRSQLLGDTKYDIQDISTPTASGTSLRFLSWLLADSPLGPLIRRALLSQETNGSALLQDLALQACNTAGNFAQWHPMQRLSKEERKLQEEAAKVAGAEQFLAKGFDPKATSSPYVTVEDYAKAYRDGSWTASQAMERFLQSVKELQPKFKPFVLILDEEIRAQAKESDRRFRSKNPRSIFEGVPVAVKDMFRVRGHPMLEGSVWPEGSDHNQPSEKDNTVVRLFREAGAIIVGTTAMTEFGVTPLGYSAHYQGPFNAYNAKHYPLGSSSGSAVAVALGLVPVAIGADAGGSIRLPASAGGVVGLACTYGRVPDDSTVVTHGTMQKSGPIAATARCAALAHMVMSAPATNFYAELYGETGLPPLHLKDFTNSNLKGVRLGVFPDYFNDAEATVVDSCQRAIDTLKSLGAEIVNIEIPHLRSLQVSHGLIVSAEISAILGDLLYNQHQLEPSTRIQFALGASMAAVETQSGNMLRGWAIQYIRKEIFQKLNISGIVTPTVGVIVPEIPPGAFATGESNTPLLLKLMKFIFLGNLCGFPGITIPVGQDFATSIPIGLHILGDQWNEALLLRLAEVLENSLKRRTPSSFVNLLGKP